MFDDGESVLYPYEFRGQQASEEKASRQKSFSLFKFQCLGWLGNTMARRKASIACRFVMSHNVSCAWSEKARYGRVEHRKTIRSHDFGL